MKPLHSKSIVLAIAVAAVADQITAAQTQQSPIPLPESVSPFSSVTRSTFGFQTSGPMLPETAAHHTDLVNKTLKAITDADHSAFIWRGSDKFQNADRNVFNVIVTRWSKRLKEGFTFIPLGEVRKNVATSVWRIRFESGGDDGLLILTTDKRGNIVQYDLI